jgi:hypothetical protein
MALAVKGFTTREYDAMLAEARHPSSLKRRAELLTACEIPVMTRFTGLLKSVLCAPFASSFEEATTLASLRSQPEFKAIATRRAVKILCAQAIKRIHSERFLHYRVSDDQSQPILWPVVVKRNGKSVLSCALFEISKGRVLDESQALHIEGARILRTYVTFFETEAMRKDLSPEHRIHICLAREWFRGVIAALFRDLAVENLMVPEGYDATDRQYQVLVRTCALIAAEHSGDEGIEAVRVFVSRAQKSPSLSHLTPNARKTVKKAWDSNRDKDKPWAFPDMWDHLGVNKKWVTRQGQMPKE